MDNSDFTILVVDDTLELLMIAERILTKAGYNVITANDGVECLEVLKDTKPDLLLLDVILPDINGVVDLCKRIKRDPVTANVFIILMSGLKTRSDDISEGLETGSDGYIARPITDREFLARVSAACRIINAEKEIRVKNNQLEIINAEKDKFFSIIAHDLRSPFNSFLGLTELMVKDLRRFTIDELQKFAESLYKNANNLYGLLTNLLEWAKMQKGITAFNPIKLNVKEIADESLDVFYETAKQKQIDLKSLIEKDVYVYVDKSMLDTIIRNLISNAIKFTDKGGNVIVSGNIVNDKVEISVKDSGIGMDDQLIKDLFKIDKQTSRKGTDNEPSTGLGLLLCKEFVDKNNGKINVNSEEGKGSEFIVSLPVV